MTPHSRDSPAPALLYFATVERSVKERLVGAAVLMAAAIILIPEMLSGPDEGRDADPGASAERSATAKSGEAGAQAGEAAAHRSTAPIKTYTIDLSQSPGATVAANIDENRAPPSEDPPSPLSAAPESPATDAQAKPEPPDEPTRSAAATTEPLVSEAQAARSAPSAPVVEPPTRTPPPAAASAPPRPLASSVATPTSSGWAVQLGSFSKQSTAEKLASDVRAQGHDAFVMPVKSGAATLYRVRIGPMPDRASAEAALSSVKAKVPGAALVANP